MKLNKMVAVASVVSAISGAAIAGSAMAYQEHMRSALDALRTAKIELQRAEHDKDGHREKALRLVDQAMNQTEAGIKAGARHS